MIRPIGLIEAATPKVLSHSEPKPPTVESYLHALACACLDAATNARVRPLLLRAPGTIAQLGRERWRIAT